MTTTKKGYQSKTPPPTKDEAKKGYNIVIQLPAIKDAAEDLHKEKS